MHDNDELDAMIDLALKSYCDAGADEQLGERLLAAVRRQTPARRELLQRRWLSWAGGLAAAACVLALVFIGLRPKPAPINTPGRPPAGTELAHVAPPSVPHAAPAGRAVRPTSTPRIGEQPLQQVAQGASLPELDVFPTPEPTPEEARSFVTYLGHAPESEVHALQQAQARANQPVTIEALKIQPLAPLDEGGR